MDKDYLENNLYTIFKIECDNTFKKHITHNYNYFLGTRKLSMEERFNDIDILINYKGFDDEYKNYIEEKIFQIKKSFNNKSSLEEFEEINHLFNSLKQNIKKKKLQNQTHHKHIEINFNLLRLLKNALNKRKRELNLISEPKPNRLKNIPTTKFILNHELYFSTSKLRNDLIKHRLIDKKQPSMILHNIFRGGEINKKINWTGTKGELGLFVKLLRINKCILNINPYIIAKNAFTIDGKTLINLRDPKKNEAENYYAKIEKIVMSFKK